MTGRLIEFIIKDDPQRTLCPECHGNKQLEIEPGLFVECNKCNGAGYITPEEFVNECHNRDSIKR